MLSDEEEEKLEQEFQYALEVIISKIKGETATAIVYCEQPMIMLFSKLKLKIRKQQKEIEELKREKAKRSWVHIKENGEVEPLFYVSEDKIKAKIEIRKEEKENCRDCIEEKYILREIYVLQSLLEKE